MANGKAVYEWTCFLTYVENEEPWTEEFDFQTDNNNWDHAYEFATRVAEEGYEPDYADLIIRPGWVHIEGSN